MKRLFIAALAGVVLALPLWSVAAPDETQKQLIQRAQEAKKKLAAAEAAQGTERQKMVQEHMKMMQDMMAQMRKAKPAAGMKPEQMREWIDEHMKLMQEMMSQMMSEHHMMMGGMQGGMQGGMIKK
jgi:ABC-type transporter MlaC component